MWEILLVNRDLGRRKVRVDVWHSVIQYFSVFLLNTLKSQLQMVHSPKHAWHNLIIRHINASFSGDMNFIWMQPADAALKN